ncbi:MAG: methyl-accepting chemotaxis protein [Candidatus Nitrosocaldaceae archaeon]
MQNIKNYTLEELAEFVEEIVREINAAIEEIDDINNETHTLAINVVIESSKAGESGRTFAVVAQRMNDLNKKIESITEKIKNDTVTTISNLVGVVKSHATNIRGIRLADLALTNIDLIDRSLYERSCDIRWWSRDSSVVNALLKKDSLSIETCIERLTVILEAYTVYHDLLVCDLEGNVICNGKPYKYSFRGKNYKDAAWFKEIKGKKGNEYVYSSVHKSEIIGEFVMIFASLVYDEMDTNKPIGVLASIFKWGDLAHSIVNNTPLNNDEKRSARICITDKDLIIADTEGRILEKIEFEGKDDLFTKKGFIITTYNGKMSCIAHALSQGYETYSSGFHSLIIQHIKY